VLIMTLSLSIRGVLRKCQAQKTKHKKGIGGSARCIRKKEEGFMRIEEKKI